MNIAIIMAGGTGSRVGTSLPKQFMTLGDKPIIMYSLEKFIESGYFDAIYIGMHPEWVEYMGGFISSAGLKIPEGGLHIISGGDTRNATLMNVIDAIEYELSESSTDKCDPVILTHDAARPFVTLEMIEKSLESARLSGASTVAIPTTDTIAVVTEHQVTSIPDRSTLFNIQTPQSFRLSSFLEAYSNLTDDQISLLTDVCGVFTATGTPIQIVPGSPENIKITTASDLSVAELFLSASHR